MSRTTGVDVDAGFLEILRGRDRLLARSDAGENCEALGRKLTGDLKSDAAIGACDECGP